MTYSISHRVLSTAVLCSLAFPSAVTAKGGPLIVRPHCINLIEMQNDLTQAVGSSSSSTSSKSATRSKKKVAPSVSVGVTLKLTNGTYYISSVAPGSAAEQSGLLPGDEIQEMDGRAVGNRFTAQTLLDALNGPEGSSVALVVGRQKDGGVVKIKLVRKAVTKLADYEMSVDGGIAYLKIRAFSPSVAKSIHTWLDSDAVKKSKGIILDVRTNPVGDATSLFSILSNFLPKGTPLGIVVGQSVSTPVKTTETSAFGATAPLVLLANEGGMTNAMVRYALVIKRISPAPTVITEAESRGKNALVPGGLSFVGMTGKDVPQQYCSEMATFTWDLLYKGETFVKPEAGKDAPLERAKTLLNK